MSLKVCYLMPRLLPTLSGQVVGGAAANCVSLALELKRRDADVELLASVSEEGMARLAGSPLAEILTPLSSCGKGLMRKGFGTLHALRRGLKARLKETQFDIVHSHSGTYPYAVVPLVADRRTSVRLHSLYCPLGAQEGLYSSWWDRPTMARLAFQRLDRVIAVTENVQRSLQEAGVRTDSIESVPMCVDTERFRPQPLPEPVRYFPDDPARVRVLFVGNASKEKGLAELLLAMKILTDKKMPVSLVAAIENQSNIAEYAAGYDRAQEFIRRAHLEDSVRLVGLVDSIDRLYAEADVLVIPWKTSRGPSDYPMVALEAMAMGTCIVSTPVGGCPELLRGGEAGILTEDFSAESIASAIASVVHDPQARKKIEQAAVERAADFSLSAAADRLIHLYERLLKSKRLRYA